MDKKNQIGVSKSFQSKVNAVMKIQSLPRDVVIKLLGAKGKLVKVKGRRTYLAVKKK